MAHATTDTEETIDLNVLEGQRIGTTNNSMNDCHDTVVTPLPHSNQGSNKKVWDTSAPPSDGIRLSRTAEDQKTPPQMLNPYTRDLQAKKPAPGGATGTEGLPNDVNNSANDSDRRFQEYPNSNQHEKHVIIEV
jgi:hypothetical protein